MHNCRILPISVDDTPEIIRIAETANLSPWSREDLVEELAHVDSFMRKAVTDQPAICGFLVSRFIPSSETATGLDVELYNIGINPHYRRRGIGSALLWALIDRAKRSKAEKIWLDVRRQNDTAISFYEHFGFVETGIRRGFYSHPDDDGVMMMLRTANIPTTV